MKKFVLLALCVWLAPIGHAFAQGVTTGALAGTVTNAQGQPVSGANVIAIHEPSGTSYEGVTRADGRYSIPGMRVGGPYSVTAAYTGAGGTAFEPQTKTDVTVNLGVATDVNFNVTAIAVQESITVSAVVDPVFSSGRTGAATSVSRTEIATLPTLSGRLGDVTRLTPQASGNNFAGQGDRGNNYTVDGSFFNNSFGISGSPGERTNVAAISLEAVEQIQVNVAPFDVRQGAFVGAGVNMVTRSGTNQLSGAAFHKFRSNDWVGTEAKGQVVNPGTFTFRNSGGTLGGPILRNKWFAFGNFEDELDKRPLTNFRANAGNEPEGGSVTRVLASDLTELSSFLADNFKYQTGVFNDIPDETPVRRFLVRSDYNINNNSKLTVRYSHLDSLTDTAMSTSNALGFGRSSNTRFLAFQNSNYQILENIRSTIGEWNVVLGNSMANQLISGYTTQDESRKTRYGGDLFPFVDILDGSGTAYTSFGFEPFTPYNELRYNTFQLQNNLTRFGTRHTWTFGASTEKYHSYNSFYPGMQSAYVYNTLQDFYTDARGYVANPNRTTSPVTVRRFQVRYSNIPGVINPPQPLDVWYSGGYVQDEIRPTGNLTITAGIRADVSMFGETAYANPNADALTFRDEAGQAVQYQSGALPDTRILWSPRVGVNWDVNGTRATQVRGGSGLFSGRPAYVWISNQIGNTGVLAGFTSVDNTTAFPFHPDPERYKPVLTSQGAPATSYELNVTDPDFKFPQVWRSNIAIDQRLPWNITSTTEFLYNRDVNGMYYINANLPAAQAAFTGADARPRWTGPSCAAPTAGPCATRLNNAAGNVITNAYVLKNTNLGRSWVWSQALQKAFSHGLSLRGAYSYGESKNTVDPGSTAGGNFSSIRTFTSPNTPGLGYSSASPGHRVYALVSYSKQYLGHLGTSVTAFWESRTLGNTSYTFAGDMNGDSVAGNDLIYIPRDTSEMNFSTFTHTNGRVFTAAEQATAFEAYIQQDPYLRKHRGQYAERNGVFLPMVTRLDLSLNQDVFHNIGGKRNTGSIRFDINNLGNLLNSDWGVGQSIRTTQLLTNPAADSQGRATYRLAVFNNELANQTFQTTTSPTFDVYQFRLSFRYGFN